MLKAPAQGGTRALGGMLRNTCSRWDVEDFGAQRNRSTLLPAVISACAKGRHKVYLRLSSSEESTRTLASQLQVCICSMASPSTLSQDAANTAGHLKLGLASCSRGMYSLFEYIVLTYRASI